MDGSYQDGQKSSERQSRPSTTSAKVICGKKPKKDKDKDKADEEDPTELPTGDAPIEDTPEGAMMLPTD